MGIRTLGCVVLVMLGSCIEWNPVLCGDGRACPDGTTCDPALSRCLAPGQREACAGLADGDRCTYDNRTGTCHAGACSQIACGDGIAEGTEECDGNDLRGIVECVQLGYDSGGSLACKPDCHFDRTACSGICGDGVVDPDEDCEPGAAQSLTNCTELGYYDSAALGCNGACRYDASSCTGFCGDGIKNGGEDCDGSAVGAACTSLGFYDPGTPGCNAACRFDVSACTGYCGDLQVNGPEVCDGRPPGIDTCVDLGFAGGMLTCSNGCAPYLSSCLRQGWRIVADYPTFAYFYGEWGTRTDDMYFVGEEGLFHWNGATLAPVPGVPSFVGFSMWGSGPSDIWALGEGGAGYHFDGTTWTAKPAPGQVLSMWGSASNDVYAVGIAGQYHFDGTSWSVLSTTGMNTVHGSSATNVWVGGDGGVLRHYDGMTWATVDPGVTSSIRAIYAFSPTHVLIGTNNGISRMVGTTWTFEASAFVSAFAATSPSNVWAGTGIGEILHYDGVGWSTRTQPDQLDTAALFLVDGSLFEIGAENAVFRYDGLTVTATPSGTTARLNNVWGNAFSAFAVGDSGTILRWNGQAWSAMVSNTTIPLLAVWGTGPNNVYAAGSTATTGSGVLLHYDGNATNTWQAVAGRTDKYTEIWGSGTDDIYVACMRNSPLTTPCNSLHWNGSTWSVLQPNGFDFSTVWGRSATDVYIGLATPYALGTQSPFQHWNGTTWTTLAWPEEGVLDGGPNSVVSLGHQAPSQTEALMRRESDTVRTDISPNWSSGGGGTTAQRLMADVLVDGPGDMTAVGVEGIALHFDGTTWWRLATGVSEDLHAIGGTGRTAFAVGDAGRIVMIARDDGGAACPSAGAEQDCSDGIDNDCDFLIDARDPDCRGSGVCWAPTTMTCGSTVNATFGSGADTIRTYSCTTRQKIGHEDIYRVVPAANGTVAATLTNLGGNFDLMAVGSGPSGACDPAGNCLAVSENASTTDESVSVAVTASQPLFLIVDDEGGYASAQTYTLTVTCQ